MRNLAGCGDALTVCPAELVEAGIPYFEVPFEHGFEVPFRHVGFLHGWVFKRLWCYWSVQAMFHYVLPFHYANFLHRTHGKVVRVEGHCGCPAPEEWCKPSRGHMGVSSYHVDSAEGLKALADTIKKWHDEVATEVNHSDEDFRIFMEYNLKREWT